MGGCNLVFNIQRMAYQLMATDRKWNPVRGAFQA